MLSGWGGDSGISSSHILPIHSPTASGYINHPVPSFFLLVHQEDASSFEKHSAVLKG